MWETSNKGENASEDDMTFLKLSAAALLAASVSACSTIETVTRNVPFGLNTFGEPRQAFQRDYTVRNMVFAVPDDLRVSEGNGYYPFTDIVWRGDPVGDRGAQIGAMFGEAMTRNNPTMQGSVPVIVDVNLVRFHGVTERTRYSVGGNYNIVFRMTVRHAVTGEVLEPSRRVVGNLSAPGGVAAILAEQRGQSEKVRVTDFLTLLLRDELTGQATL